MARGYRMDDTVYVMEATGSTPEALRAAISAVGDGAKTARVYHRPGVPDIADLGGERFEASYAYYAKISDPVAAVNLLGPELQRRHGVRGRSEYTGVVTVSFYRWSVEIEFASGQFVEARRGGSIEAPIASGFSTVPPDLVAHLLVGADGVEALSARHPDVMLGKQKDILAALFPPLTSDVQTWVAP